MVEWNIYVNGGYVGTVFANTETEAITAGLYKFEINDGDVTATRR
jgi:hypothetical protein